MVQAPLGALRTFEAVARHGSFSRAANELCVTQSAVSHQQRSIIDVLRGRQSVARRLAATQHRHYGHRSN